MILCLRTERMTTKYFIVCFFICVIEAYATPTEQTSGVLGNVKNELEMIGNEISLGFQKVETGIVDRFHKMKNNIEQNPEIYNKMKKDLKDLGQKISNGLKEAERVVVNEYRTVEHTVEDKFKSVKTAVLQACACTKYSCGCCAHLEESEIELNATICTNITYLVHDYGISFTVTVNNYALFNETVSARNPPPVCLGVPYVKELADVCVRLYDINATTTYLHACVRIEARMKTILVAKYDLGCFNIGPLGEPPRVRVTIPTEKDIERVFQRLSATADEIPTENNIERVFQRHSATAGEIPTENDIERVFQQHSATAGEIPTEKDIEKVFQKHSATAQNTSNVDLIIIIGSDEVPELTTLDTTNEDYELDFAKLNETESNKSSSLVLPIVASLIAVVLISILALVVYITIKKRRNERRVLQFMKQYGSTKSLVPPMDPYC